MSIRSLKLAAIGVLSACALVFLLKGAASTDVTHEGATSGLGTTENLEANYKMWEEQYVKDGGDRNVVMAMGWFKGLSTEGTYAKGVARLNLVDGNSRRSHGTRDTRELRLLAD